MSEEEGKKTLSRHRRWQKCANSIYFSGWSFSKKEEEEDLKYLWAHSQRSVTWHASKSLRRKKKLHFFADIAQANIKFIAFMTIKSFAMWETKNSQSFFNRLEFQQQLKPHALRPRYGGESRTFEPAISRRPTRHSFQLLDGIGWDKNKTYDARWYFALVLGSEH